MTDTVEKFSIEIVKRAHRKATQRFRIEEYKGLLAWFYPIIGEPDAFMQFQGDSFEDIKSTCVAENLPLPQLVFAATLEELDPNIDVLEMCISDNGIPRPHINDEMLLELHAMMRDFLTARGVKVVVPDLEIAIDLPVSETPKAPTPDRSLN